MKKLIITLFLLMAALPSIAQTQFWYHGVHYELWSDGVEVIEADNNTYSGEIVIPNSVGVMVNEQSGGGQYEKFFDVRGIGPSAFAGCTGLTRIVLPPTLTTISANAFTGCTGLTSIELPASVNVVGYNAFSGCTGLTRVVMSGNMEEISEGAFKNCTALTSVTLPSRLKRIYRLAFGGCSSLSSITIPNQVKSIYQEAFSGCTSLKSVVIPNSVTMLGWNVFYNCTSLTSVTLSNNLSTLDYTFSGCTSLTSVDIPASVTYLYGTFKGCTSLTTLKLPPLLTRIGSSVFEGCTSLSSIYIPNSVTLIENRAFANTSLTSIELPSTITQINYSAFDGCNQLTSVTSRRLSPPRLYQGFSSETYGLATLFVPAVSVEQYNAADCWKLFENVMGVEAYNTTYDFIVNGLKYLVMDNNTVCLLGAESLDGTELTVPASVTHGGVTYSVTGIGDYAFDQKNLTSLNLPESLTSIGAYAFRDCYGLTSLTIPENVTAIGEGAFSGLTNLSRIVWNARECYSCGIPYNMNGVDLPYYYSDINYLEEYYDQVKTNLTELIIGNEVQVLPAGLAANSQITSIDFPTSLKYIGAYAFHDCMRLTSLTIPVNVTGIGENAFFMCKGLTSLTWNARECWDYGGMYALCAPIPTGYYDDTHEVICNFTDITIGDEVEVLPSDFARNTSITSIELPASLREIGDYAFYNCWNVTSSIILSDAVTEVGDYAFGGCARVNSLTVGRNVAYIGKGAFGRGYDETAGYESVPAMYPQYLRWNARCCNSAGSLLYSQLRGLYIDDQVEVLPDGFGSYASYLNSVDLPEHLSIIGNCAFQSCGNLTTLDIPASVTHIGGGAFQNCNKLTALYIPASVTYIGNGAFRGCSAMASITVDNGNQVYDSRDNCNAAIHTADNTLVIVCKNTIIHNTITSIPDFAFYQMSSLTGLNIPTSVKSIGRYAFAFCYGLTDMVIPNSVTTLGGFAFMSCYNLSSVSLSKSLTQIEPYTFAYCDQLKSVIIPYSVDTICNYAFNNCYQMEDITIGPSVKYMGEYALDCYNMNSLNCYAITPPEVFSNTFGYNYSNVTLRVPMVAVEDYAAHEVWGRFNNIEGIAGAGPGDVNGDGDFSISDVSGLIDLLLNGNELPIFADVDGDGKVTVKDVTELINMLLSMN